MKILNDRGYDIFFDEYIPENVNKIVIALHGFSSSRMSTCITMLKDKIYNYNIGVITFDFPAHGESLIDGKYLLVDNCLKDLDFIFKYIKNKYPNVEVSLFASIFGGYIGLLYQNLYNIEFKDVILRAPAIRMYDVFCKDIIDDKVKNELIINGSFKFGYDRIINIHSDFIEELKKYDLFQLYDGKKNLKYNIIHGTIDDVVPVDDSIEFCKKFGAILYEIKGADHRFKKEGQLDQVIDIALNILK